MELQVLLFKGRSIPFRILRMGNDTVLKYKHFTFTDFRMLISLEFLQ